MKGNRAFEGQVPEVEMKIENGRAIIAYNFSKQELTIEGEEITSLNYNEVRCRPVSGDIIAAIVREKYSANDVEAIILNGSDTEEHAAEYNALMEHRAMAKQIATKVLE